ncbi:MAG: hypothetical protein PVG67_14040 [Desulfobacterales bacterium]|jgi:threonine synthase
MESKLDMEYDNRPFNLVDGATGESFKIIREVDEKKKISENPELPMESRLEAYEDIFDSEVGDTSLVRARNIEREVGLRQIYLKFEGGNPTGTQKDRIAFAQAMDALRRCCRCACRRLCGSALPSLYPAGLSYESYKRDDPFRG